MRLANSNDSENRERALADISRQARIWIENHYILKWLYNLESLGYNWSSDFPSHKLNCVVPKINCWVYPIFAGLILLGLFLDNIFHPIISVFLFVIGGILAYLYLLGFKFFPRVRCKEYNYAYKCEWYHKVFLWLLIFMFFYSANLEYRKYKAFEAFSQKVGTQYSETAKVHVFNDYEWPRMKQEKLSKYESEVKSLKDVLGFKDKPIEEKIHRLSKQKPRRHAPDCPYNNNKNL